MLAWIAQNSWVVWLALVLVLALIEMLTLDLFFIMLSGGALAAMAVSFATDNLVVQILTFCVVALLLVVIVRPVALNHLGRPEAGQRTNIDSLIGEPAVVLEPVGEHSGLVKIGGDTWTARSADGTAIPVGSAVRVHRISGATAIVAHPENRSSL
ncbi:membrane protein [Tersicoccus solisilvae]|uniref:Membrane protein n=1 Tax=Tersicoccus solisilvae TaxID=1882339 RepID=A0ABQ1NV02_9MICC|nr:NfeD family protein [Tersicoccus solisilvae]GGC83572.1 membrane protein [Tersicoccus solisilvae]